MTAAGTPETLVGGVGYRFQRDGSFGLVASDQLAGERWPAGVKVEDLGYGALYVAQDLLHASPRVERLLLLSAASRGREPGRVYRWRWQGSPAGPEEIQELVREAGAGVVHIDHLLVIAGHLGALPPHVEIIELEPVDTASGEGLSPAGERALGEALALVREAIGSPGPGSAR